MGGSCGRNGGEAMHTGFWWKYLWEGDLLEGPDLDRRISLRWILKKWDRAWAGLIGLRLGTRGGLL